MMASSYSGNLGRFPTPNSGTDGLLDELTRQLAMVHRHNRQLSKGCSTQRQGNAMRVVKPRSAHNSPGSGLQARRRTLLNDGQYHPSGPRPVDESLYLPSQPQCLNSDSTRAARPFSWHPPSQFVQQPHSQVLGQTQAPYQAPVPQYPVSSYTDVDYFMSNRQLPPTPAVYSEYTSPASTFSTLSHPISGFAQQTPQYFPPQASWAALPELSPPAPTPAPLTDTAASALATSQASTEKSGTTMESWDSWDSFVVHGFNRCTAPPTPKDFVAAPQPEPRLQSEESIPYQALEGEEEEEGEVLYGMGLYDTPEKPMDAQLEYHRSAISSLLGSTFTYPEPTGKGLKLEDAWEPPASEDGDSQEDDDAEGDDQQE